MSVSDDVRRVLVRIGGIFTAFVVVRIGELSLKWPSTTDRDFAESAVNVLSKCSISTGSLKECAHVTAVAVHHPLYSPS